MGQFANLNLSELPPSSVNIATAMAIAVGTLYCFLGYRVFKFVLGLTGFILAGSVAGGLAGLLSDGRLIITAPAALLGGVAGAFALFFLYKAGVFCLGALAGALVAHTALVGETASWAAWAVLAAAVFGGVLALVVERPVMTMATATLGAWIVVGGFAYVILGPTFLEGLDRPLEVGEPRWVMLCSWAVLSVAGALAQFATHKHRIRSRTKE